MELKSLLEEFDEVTATHEEEAKKSAEKVEETKAEDNNTKENQETIEEVVAPVEAEAVAVTEVAETPADNEVKETPADEVEASEEAEKAPKAEEEKAEKSADAKKEDKKKDSKDEEDSDEDETDPKKKAKKKPVKADKEKDEDDKEEKAKKSDSNDQMVGLLEAVLKSYHTSTTTQTNLVAKIDSLEATVKSLSAKLEATEEEISKSLNVDEIKNAVAEQVEDKAVGYATKSASTEDLAPNATDEVIENEVVTPEGQEVFDPNNPADRSAFLNRFKQENQAGKMSRGTLEGYREAYLTAGEGRADATQLQKLHEFIK